ncbi:MAG: flagellar hook-associated protein FlgK, partial [Pseudomonadota bacterium]
MSFQALNTAITGLRAAQSQLSTISNNITNATTEGYNRQILPQSTQVLRESGQTVGVLTEKVIRVVDMNLQRDLWTQVSASSMQSVQVDYLQQIQSFNGPPDKEFSIAAKLAELRDSFSALSDIPDDPIALEQTVYDAGIVADKFNDYADLLTQLRNDAQGDLQTSINTVNSLLQEITDINIQVRSNENFGNSVAGLKDQRDIAIKALTEEIDISFFERGDGVLVVQTREGQELAGDVAQRLELEVTAPISALQFYPDTVGGLILVTETNSNTTRTDITENIVGGRLGGLLEMRDSILPSYHAQLDELAYQTANRIAEQGLILFTDQNGNVPENIAPDPTTDPPTPVSYVDFARNIQVNRAIIDDPSILQRGTYAADVNIPTGDNSVIQRVLENAFGEVSFQQAVGTIDLTDAGANPELQDFLGLDSINQLAVGIDFTSFQQIDDPLTVDETQLVDSFQEVFPNYPANDTFQITFEEARGPTPFGPT